MSLSRQLRAHLQGATLLADDGALEALLRERLAVARKRWPAVRLEDDVFLRHLARHPVKTLAALDALELEDLFLACACSLGDGAALAELDRGILSNVPRWLSRVQGVSAEDVQQELRQKLLVGPGALILGYSGRSSLERWIRVAANRCAVDQQRANKAPGAVPLERLYASPDPELDLIRLHDQTALREVLQAALKGLAADERNLLRLHYVESTSLEKLAVMEGVHRATVARKLAVARAAVLANVREGMRRRLKLSAKELASLLRFVGSRLELSLRRVLANPSTPRP